MKLRGFRALWIAFLRDGIFGPEYEERSQGQKRGERGKCDEQTLALLRANPGDEEQDGDFTKLHLQVAEPDVGKVIGRGGRTAQALRTVVRAAATHEKRRVLIDIVD